MREEEARSSSGEGEALKTPSQSQEFAHIRALKVCTHLHHHQET